MQRALASDDWGATGTLRVRNDDAMAYARSELDAALAELEGTDA